MLLQHVVWVSYEQSDKEVAQDLFFYFSYLAPK